MDGIVCCYSHANSDVTDGAWHVVWHGLMTGMGTQLQDQMMTAGVVGYDWVMCMGHGQHDVL